MSIIVNFPVKIITRQADDPSADSVEVFAVGEELPLADEMIPFLTHPGFFAIKIDIDVYSITVERLQEDPAWPYLGVSSPNPTAQLMPPTVYEDDEDIPF